MIPNSSHKHLVFDSDPETWEENTPSPWSQDRIEAFQGRINRIAGLAYNGWPNVRLMWAAGPVDIVKTVDVEPDASFTLPPTMEWVKDKNGKYSRRGRYRLFTQEYEVSGTDLETGLEVVQSVDLDICVRRFMVEEYHVPAEARFNPKVATLGHGFYSNLWTVAQHSADCCNGDGGTRKGRLCLGLYREPSDRDLEELARRVKERDASTLGHMPGDEISHAETLADARRDRNEIEAMEARRLAGYQSAIQSALTTHAWKMFAHTPTAIREGKWFDYAKNRRRN
jgi:hypothetical protein